MLPSAPYLDEPIEVVCAATYYAELIPAYAFVFRVPATWTRFTIYAAAPDAYTINHTYQLAIAAPLAVPALPAPPDSDARHDGHTETAQTPPSAESHASGTGVDEEPEYVTLTVVLSRQDGQRWRWLDVCDNDPPMWLDVGVPQFWAAEPGITDAATTLGAEVEEPFPTTDRLDNDRDR